MRPNESTSLYLFLCDRQRALRALTDLENTNDGTDLGYRPDLGMPSESTNKLTDLEQGRYLLQGMDL